MTFVDSAENGNVAAVLKYGVVNGALWAIGIAWATGIREIALIILPTDNFSKVIGEVVALLIVTVMSTLVALVAAYEWSKVRQMLFSNSEALPQREQRNAANDGARRPRL